MRINDICRRSIVTCRREDSVGHAAREMRDRFTEDLIVVEDASGHAKPIGIVTFRDMVVRVVAMGLDANCTLVGDVMSASVDTVLDSELVYAAIGRMRDRGISRLVVVDSRGWLVGVLTAKDITEFLASELTEVSRISPDGQRLAVSDVARPASAVR